MTPAHIRAQKHRFRAAADSQKRAQNTQSARDAFHGLQRSGSLGHTPDVDEALAQLLSSDTQNGN